MDMKTNQVEGTALGKSQKFESVACVERCREFIQKSIEIRLEGRLGVLHV